MTSIEEAIKSAGLEVNKHTPKLVRVKGGVSKEVLENLLVLTADFGIIEGSIDEASSQIFLFYGEKEVEVPEVAEEVDEEINITTTSDVIDTNSTVSGEHYVDVEAEPEPVVEVPEEPIEEIPDEVKDIAEDLEE